MKNMIVGLIAFFVFSPLSVFGQETGRPRVVSPASQGREKQKSIPRFPSDTPRHRLENPEDVSPYDMGSASIDSNTLPSLNDMGMGLYTTGIILPPSLRDMGVTKTEVFPEQSLGLVWEKVPQPQNCVVDCFDTWKVEAGDGPCCAITLKKSEIYIATFLNRPSGTSATCNIVILRKENNIWKVALDTQISVRDGRSVFSTSEQYFQKYFSGLVQKGCGLPDEVVNAILSVYTY